MDVNQVLLDLNDINWSELRKNREWLMKHTSIEARTLYQFINELWNDDAFYYWSMMRDQKKWLEIYSDSEESAKYLLDFIEIIQDKALDTEMLTPQEIYGSFDKPFLRLLK